MSQRLKYISRLKDDFDTLICGHNGVISCGLRLLPENIDALIKIYQSGKKIMLASNIGWRVRDLFKFLQNAGVPMNIFYTMITAGEIAHYYLQKNDFVGKKCLALNSIAENLMQKMNFDCVTDCDKADFLIVANDFGIEDTYQNILENSLSRRLPLLCVGNNTSLITPYGVKSGAGAVAEQYAMMGGDIIPFGKPDVRIAAYLSEDINDFKNSRCLVVGDTMATDMRLGNSFKAQTLFITGGCHQMLQPTAEAVDKLAAQYGLQVDYFAENLQW